ncbi:DUF2782 domain-containing protein [Janthinobacterium agaricidamnosum]|uniref:DUF2782 domain-containing protein n=1 Tax=Janthinobacterium agaricidamnosum TaxID=55508 RepID=UPI000571C594|nr:DUF2782 domain-containing protein [Janthinobacterium agaricidamnosum]
MMRTSTIWHILGLSLLVYTASAGAQQRPSDAPPKLEQIEDAGDPAVTVTSKPTEQKITEKREQGKVSEVKVSTGGSTYYLKPSTAAGTSVPGDATSSGNRGAQWQILEFDLGKKKQKQKEEEAADNTPEPPPPAK